MLLKFLSMIASSFWMAWFLAIVGGKKMIFCDISTVTCFIYVDLFILFALFWQEISNIFCIGSWLVCISKISDKILDHLFVSMIRYVTMFCCKLCLDFALPGLDRSVFHLRMVVEWKVSWKLIREEEDVSNS